MNLSQRLRIESTTVRLGLLTLVGMVIELVLALPVMSYAVTLLTVPTQVVASNVALITITLGAYPFILGYTLFPIVYCTLVSFLAIPRRLISPLNIQIGTFVFGTIIVLDKALFSTPYFGTLPSVQITNLATVLTVYLVVAGVFTVTLGFVQTIAVRFLIGLNLEDLDPVSYRINASLSFLNTQMDKNFRDSFNLSKQTDDDGIVIMKGNNDALSIVLCIKEFRDEISEKVDCILATVAYESRFTVVTKTEAASTWRDSFVWALRGKSMRQYATIEFVRLETLDDPASMRAYNLAKEPTEGRVRIGLQFLSGLPKELKSGIIVTVIAWLAIFFIWAIQYLSNDGFIGTSVFIIVALFVEIGIALREDTSRSKSTRKSALT